MPSPAIDRIARKNAPVQVPKLPSVSAISAAAQRKDLVTLGASLDLQNEEWRKKLQLALETAIAAALLSLSTSGAGTGADGATGPQGERGATGATGPQGPAGGGDVATDTIWDAAGDLAVGTGSNTAARLAVGDVGSALFSDGTTAEWFHPRTHSWAYDDFLSCEIASDVGAYGLQRYVSGGAISSAASPAGRHGVVELSTSTGSTNYAVLLFRGPNNITFGGGRFVYETSIKLPTLSTGSQRYKVQIGITDDNGSGTPTDGVWFEYSDSVNSGNWQYKSAQAGTTTTSNSSIAATTSWTRLTIEVNAAGNSVDYYIDGVSAGSAITTNIPSGANVATFAWGIIKSIGTTASTLQSDYWWYYTKLTTSR